MSAAVLAKCTRNGVVSWSNVAKMLGCSVETAKARCGHLTPRQDPQQIGEWAMTDAEAYRSPHPKTDGMKALILALMDRNGSMSAEALAVLCSSTPNSIRMRLSQLGAAGYVAHDGRWPRTFWLTADGKAIARTYRERPGRIGQGASSGGRVPA